MTATSTTFRWTEKYSVKTLSLDNHHKSFFANINQLNDALASGTGGSVTGRILQKLIDHALHHFAAEETLMAEYGFPRTAAHRTEHDKFTQAVAKFLADHRAVSPAFPSL